MTNTTEATVIQRNTLKAAIASAREAGYLSSPRHASRVKIGKQVSWCLYFTSKDEV